MPKHSADWHFDKPQIKFFVFRGFFSSVEAFVVQAGKKIAPWKKKYWPPSEVSEVWCRCCRCCQCCQSCQCRQCCRCCWSRRLTLADESLEGKMLNELESEVSVFSVFLITMIRLGLRLAYVCFDDQLSAMAQVCLPWMSNILCQPLCLIQPIKDLGNWGAA